MPSARETQQRVIAFVALLVLCVGIGLMLSSRCAMVALGQALVVVALCAGVAAYVWPSTEPARAQKPETRDGFMSVVEHDETEQPSPAPAAVERPAVVTLTPPPPPPGFRSVAQRVQDALRARDARASSLRRAARRSQESLARSFSTRRPDPYMVVVDGATR